VGHEVIMTNSQHSLIDSASFVPSIRRLVILVKSHGLVKVLISFSSLCLTRGVIRTHGLNVVHLN
jgi:hypothetical protein